MMYASRITIKYESQKVRYQREVELPDRLLTLNDISKHLKDGEEFGFREVESSVFGANTIIDIVGYRLETKEELKKRVAKQEKYNKNYEKHEAKYGR